MPEAERELSDEVDASTLSNVQGEHHEEESGVKRKGKGKDKVGEKHEIAILFNMLPSEIRETYGFQGPPIKDLQCLSN